MGIPGSDKHLDARVPIPLTLSFSFEVLQGTSWNELDLIREN